MKHLKKYSNIEFVEVFAFDDFHKTEYLSSYEVFSHDKKIGELTHSPSLYPINLNDFHIRETYKEGKLTTDICGFATSRYHLCCFNEKQRELEIPNSDELYVRMWKTDYLKEEFVLIRDVGGSAQAAISLKEEMHKHYLDSVKNNNINSFQIYMNFYEGGHEFNDHIYDLKLEPAEQIESDKILRVFVDEGSLRGTFSIHTYSPRTKPE